MKPLNTNKSILIIFLFLVFQNSNAQSRIDSIQKALVRLAVDYPGLNENVEMSVTEVSLSDFLNALAISNKLNISVDESLTFNVNNNFTNVSVSDVLIFLCKKYDLDIVLVGSIINVKKYQEPSLPVPKAQPKTFTITYNKEKDLLNVDLKNDTLYLVARELTKETGFNVVAAKDIENVLVSGFIKDQAFAGAIDVLTYTNNLKVKLTDAGYYLIEKIATPSGTNASIGDSRGQGPSSIAKKKGTVGISIEDGLITLDAVNVPIQDIIISISDKLKLNYFIFADLKGNDP